MAVAAVSSVATLLFTKGFSGLFGSLRTEASVVWLLQHPILGGLGLGSAFLFVGSTWYSHRLLGTMPADDRMAEYILQRVEQLDVKNYVPKYSDKVNLPRHVEYNLASAAIQTVCSIAAPGQRSRISQLNILRSVREVSPGSTDIGTPKLGICIFGPPGQGKTRLAFRLMREMLKEWLFVRWPHEPQHLLDLSAYQGKRIVLWLDNLHDYVTNPHEAYALRDLPDLLTAAGIHFVVIATCRDGAQRERATTFLGATTSDLLNRLVPIELGDIDHAEAMQIERELEREGHEVPLDQFDNHTPGSILLMTKHMRTRRYPVLTESAKHVLSALQVLRQIGIYTYPTSLVKRTVEDLYQTLFSDSLWNAVLNELMRAKFVQQNPIQIAGDPLIQPLTPIYLEEVAPPLPSASLGQSLRKLRDCFKRYNMAGALVSLGNAFRNMPPISGLDNNREAIECYEGVILIHKSSPTPTSYAAAQMGLGVALYAQAATAKTSVRDRERLLRRATDALTNALALYSSTGTARAEAQYALGNALWQLQAITPPSQEQIDLLQQATSAYREAKAYYERRGRPDLFPQGGANA